MRLASFASRPEVVSKGSFRLGKQFPATAGEEEMTLPTWI